MATGGLKEATYKGSSDEEHTCMCRACKNTLCQYCKKSPKKTTLLGPTSEDVTDEPEAASVPSIVNEEMGSRSGSRYWDVNFSGFFSKTFKKLLEIKPISGCFTFRSFNKIWALTGNSINVYNTKGNNLITMDINSPKAVAKAVNGDIFIACESNYGMYVVDHNEYLQKISYGSFADVYAYKDKVYALKHEEKLIMEFCCRPEVDDVKERWASEKEWSIDEASEYDTLIVTGDEDLELYVSHWDSHTVSQYNTQGQCIKQFGSRQETGDGNLQNPMLCGVDRQSHILVADMGNSVYKILDPAMGEWRSTGVKGECQVCEANLDDEGSLWVSQYSDGDYVITKHEPQ